MALTKRTPPAARAENWLFAVEGKSKALESAHTRLPWWLALAWRPAARLKLPFAVLLLPPGTVEASPLAWLSVPPPTALCPAVAVLLTPPSTEEAKPEALLPLP